MKAQIKVFSTQLLRIVANLVDHGPSHIDREIVSWPFPPAGIAIDAAQIAAVGQQ
jgi:hypothetical protein